MHIIPNGEIKTVINHSRGNSLAIIDIGVAYEEDSDKAINILKDIGERYYESNRDRVVEPPEVLGIISLGDSDVKIRMIVRTASLKHWSVEREIRKEVKEAFIKENIEIPYPRIVYINRTDKE